MSSAPWGSAGILPISWMYVQMMGAEGVTRATEMAVLAANYIAQRLRDHYPVLYTGTDGLVAHECIIDLRPLAAVTGVDNDDARHPALVALVATVVNTTRRRRSRRRHALKT